MPKVIAIGVQDFGQLRRNDCFYVDKTQFISEWWERQDAVTLITRPRRFGKTMTMSMLDYFLSADHKDCGRLFEGLKIWEQQKYRELQGTYPVLFLSFAGVKENTYEKTRIRINQIISDTYRKFYWLRDQKFMTPNDLAFWDRVNDDMDESVSAISLNRLCVWLENYYQKKCIILLDEYDTPMQEAFIHRFWDELTIFIRTLFNNTFKTNTALGRGIMTGITRISKESVFSDLNNLNAITTTSGEYEAAFGFTQEEVFASMDEQNIPAGEKEKVKQWYDGFTFGKVSDIYNPWSILMYLDKQTYEPFWANTSGNSLISKLIREGDCELKTEFEKLLEGGYIEAKIDEQLVFCQLSENRNAIWSLLLASGYLTVHSIVRKEPNNLPLYRLSLTNYEVKLMFIRMIGDWFASGTGFNEFVSAMFKGDVRSMNHYMNRVALNTFSFFDTGQRPSGQKEPERFYHGFVLGLLVDKADSYMVKSNRESGFGRYDVVMEPKDAGQTAVIMEFKVFDRESGEKSLSDTAQSALQQIRDKKYAADLLQRGISPDHIIEYGFAFEGETCLIQKA